MADVLYATPRKGPIGAPRRRLVLTPSHSLGASFAASNGNNIPVLATILNLGCLVLRRCDATYVSGLAYEIAFAVAQSPCGNARGFCCF